MDFNKDDIREALFALRQKAERERKKSEIIGRHIPMSEAEHKARDITPKTREGIDYQDWAR